MDRLGIWVGVGIALGALFVAAAIVYSSGRTAENECQRSLNAGHLAAASGKFEEADTALTRASQSCESDRRPEVAGLGVRIARSRSGFASSPVNSTPAEPPEPPALTLESARTMSREQRRDRLRSECFSSGICDDDAVEVLTSAADSSAERAELKKIRDVHEGAARKRARVLLGDLRQIVARARFAKWSEDYSHTVECMELARSEWQKVDPIRSELDKMALTIPGVSALRSGAYLVRICTSACVEPTERMCGNAQKSLDDADREMRSAGM